MLQNMSMTEAFCENEITFFFFYREVTEPEVQPGWLWVGCQAEQVELVCVCIMTLMWNISRDEQSF